MSLFDNLMWVWGVAAVVAACFGSFITLLVYRLPRDEVVAASRSRCPSCHTTLGVRDLVPILSYLMSRGHCRYCNTRIPWRYLAIEVVTVLSTLGLLYHYGPTAQWLVMTALVYCLIVLVVIDLEHYLIPNEVQMVMAVLALVQLLLTGRDVVPVLAAAAVAGGLGLAVRYGFWKLKKKHGLGMGDVKFFAVAALWLGLEGFAPFLFYAGLSGIALGLAWRWMGRGERFPFGPALAASLLICLMMPVASQWFWQLMR